MKAVSLVKPDMKTMPDHAIIIHTRNCVRLDFIQNWLPMFCIVYIVVIKHKRPDKNLEEFKIINAILA